MDEEYLISGWDITKDSEKDVMSPFANFKIGAYGPMLPFRYKTGPFAGCLYPVSAGIGEITIIASPPFGGKSTLATQIPLGLIERPNEITYIATKESRETVFARIAGLFFGKNKCHGSLETHKRFERVYDDVRKYFNVVKDKSLVSKPEYLVATEGGIVIVDQIDPVRESNEKEQDNIATKLSCVGEELKTYFLTATTAERENYEIFRGVFSDSDSNDYQNIRVSESLLSLADNILILYPNRPKLKKLYGGGIVSDKEPDYLLHVTKQRNGPSDLYVPLWFDWVSSSFCDSRERKPYEPYLSAEDIEKSALEDIEAWRIYDRERRSSS